MKNKDVFKQCRAAAIAMNAVFPRGIQVFRLGCTTASWYFSVFGHVKSESFEDGVDFSSMQCGMASLLYEGCTFVPVLYPSFQCRLGRLLECCYHCMWQGVCEHTGAVSMMLATPLPKPHPYVYKFCAKLPFYLEYPSEAPADVSYTVMRHMLVLRTPSGGYYGSPGICSLPCLSLWTWRPYRWMRECVSLKWAVRIHCNNVNWPLLCSGRCCPTAFICSSLGANLSCGTSLRLAMFCIRA